MDTITVSKSGFDNEGRADVAHEPGEVPQTHVSKRQRLSAEPASHVPPESRKTAASTEIRLTHRTKPHRTGSQPAEHEERTGGSGTQLGLTPPAALRHTQTTTAAADNASRGNDAGGNLTGFAPPNAMTHTQTTVQIQELFQRSMNFEQQSRYLQPLGCLDLREQSRRLQVENGAAMITSVKSASQNRKNKEVAKKDIQYKSRRDEIRISHLKEQIARLRQHYEDQLKITEDHHGTQTKADTSQIALLQEKLRTLTESKLIERTKEGRFPIGYDPKHLHAKWSSTIPRLINIFEKSHKGVSTASGGIQSLANIHLLLRTAAIFSTIPNEHLRIEDYFVGVSKPNVYCLVMVCFMARALRWCFDTNFHIDVLRCTKIQEVWEALATYSGLDEVRKLDMLTTVQKVNNQHFRNNEVPHMAKRQLAVFLDEFEEYLPVNDDMLTEELQRRLIEVMAIKLQLLTFDLHHKIAFIPPGTPFDRNWMTAEFESGGGVSIKEDRQYRVCLCMSPALIGNVNDASRSSEASTELQPTNFRDALLESRNFFPKEAGQWKGWPGSHLLSPATVLVEEVPHDVATMASTSTDHMVTNSDEESS